MTTLRNVLGRTTVQGVVALLIAVTLCYLAVTGVIGAEGFLGVAALPLAWLFKQGNS